MHLDLFDSLVAQTEQFAKLCYEGGDLFLRTAKKFHVAGHRQQLWEDYVSESLSLLLRCLCEVLIDKAAGTSSVTDHLLVYAFD